MLKQSLHENWRLQVRGEYEDMPAEVPGSVYADLLRAGRMKDPFWRDSEEQALRWMDQDFFYHCRFTPEEEVLKCKEAILRFEGIDTVGRAILNGAVLGSFDNMHRTWEFSVGELLHPGENSLTVELDSPTKFIREHEEYKGAEEAMKGFPALRKAHYMFGWDWGPRLPDAGIWRPVTLLGIEGARIQDALVRQKHENGRVTLRLGLSAVHTEPVEFAATLTDPQGNVTAFPACPMELVLEKPQLWWPRGYGAQPLYTVTVEAKIGGRTVDVWQRRIGLRTAKMAIEPDEYGESFAHEVNGVKIFAMGADYIPEDNLLSRMTPERTRRLLEDAALANFNCIRVWGGGFYPEDFFYDICDELGLLVWQDFMFACACYPLNDAFGENIRAEVRDNVTRLRHHPCIGLWCGNNEMEMFAAEGVFVETPRQRADYIRMYEYLIPKALREADPDAFYWPGSPSSGGGFDDPNGQSRGDVHDWSVWHGTKPFSAYRENMGRYVSEFGFQSYPALSTVESFTDPGDRNPFSYVMERHQRCEHGSQLIMAYLSQTYLYPTQFETLLYASQLLQAQAVRVGVEHFRRNRGRCMGALYWQLNDCWPAVSWSSIDYAGRWKALHYFAKRFFAPVLLSCEEEGVPMNPNAQPSPRELSVSFTVTNETPQPRAVIVKWALRDRHSRVKREETISLKVPPLESAALERTFLPEAEPYGDFVSYELYERGTLQSFGTTLFTQPKFYRFLNPELTCRLEGDEIVVQARAYAQGVEIRNAGEDLVLSDNYFDMLPGERRVKILRGRPENLRVRSVYDIR